MRHRLLSILACIFLVNSGIRAEEQPGPQSPSQEAATVAATLTFAELDELIAAELAETNSTVITDEQFLRRASFDLIGRQPTLEELQAFLNGQTATAEKRSGLIERLLASEEFGRNWANYWSDTISYRVPPPELTFLNYDPFKAWLAEQLNQNTSWDQIVQQILTGTGKVKEQPAATFVAYHEGNAVKLAAETARIFMGVQIQCAECHDHPFDEWEREQFHQLAAFFARAAVKFPWNEGIETEVKDKGKGEYVMPDAADPTKKGKEMVPTFLTGFAIEGGKPDVERRRELAALITAPDNAWFAKAYVNRIWARLMGHGFYEPVDDMGLAQPQLLYRVHDTLSAQFRDSGFDVKALFRLVMNTQAYQQGLPGDAETAEKPFAAARPAKLRGDEVFDALVTAIALPNVTPPKIAPTKEIRFPPPPKSTRDLVAETFGFDPSLSPETVTRTMNQAMLMMNNEQLQAQINAKPESGTVLSKLLAAEEDDAAVVDKLFLIVLARKPKPTEQEIAVEHVKSVTDRKAAFEDLLWSLINSTEFTTKR